jgi:hypothetical protein
MARQVGRRSGEAKAMVIARRAREEQLHSARPAAKLQDPEVRVELDWRVRGCERECSTGGRLGSIPQACARARQRATREQIKGQWCESSTGTVCRRCNRARRSCRRLRGCADCVFAAHAREQWSFSP